MKYLTKIITLSIIGILVSFLAVTYKTSLDKKAIKPSTNTHTNLTLTTLPILATKDNKVIRTDTNEPVILRGAVTDYFRYGFDKEFKWAKEPVKYDQDITHTEANDNKNLDRELNYLDVLHKSGANIVGLYLADNIEIKKNIEELDCYIRYANKLGMYVFLLPVAHDYGSNFDNTQQNIDENGLIKGDRIENTQLIPNSRIRINNDLVEIITLLANRYKNDTNVIFGFGAEPMGETFDSWNTKQRYLANIVRNENTQSLLMITAPTYPQVGNYLDKPFSMENVIYQCGGYISKDDTSYYNAQEELKQNRFDSILCLKLSTKYPTLLGEFGCNYAADFSSKNDIAIMRNFLKVIEANSLNYTAYRLGELFSKDPLSLLDIERNVTPRGKVFFDSWKKYPGTIFKY